MCVLGCMLTAHARNGNEFQTPGHCWLPAKWWDTLFLNSSKSETRLKFMNKACFHGMAPDMLRYFSCTLWEKSHWNNSQQRHFGKNSYHFNISNGCIIQTVCVLLNIHVTPRVFVLMVVGGVVRTAAWPWLNGRRASIVQCACWPRGVQAVLQCAGSPGSVWAVRCVGSLGREPFDFHGRPPSSQLMAPETLFNMGGLIVRLPFPSLPQTSTNALT